MTQKSSELDVFLILRKNVKAKAVPEIGRFDDYAITLFAIVTNDTLTRARSYFIDAKRSHYDNPMLVIMIT